MARPRSSEIDARILRAARELVAELGYDRLTMPAVARRAGVGHPTVYRRYRDKSELAIALSVADSVPAAVPDTGTFAGDLELAEQALVGSLSAAPRALVGSQVGAMIADAGVSEQLRTRLMDRADELLRPVWQRAVDRGEVDPALDGEAALRAFSYPIVVNVLVMHRDPEGPWRSQNRAVFLRGVAPR